MKINKLILSSLFILNLFSCSSGGNNNIIQFYVYEDFTASVAVCPDYDYKDLVIPSTVTHEGNNYIVTSITADAFKGNRYIESVTIPDSIKITGWDAFRDCKKLKQVNLGSGLTVLADHVFADCKKLSAIEGGENIETIYNGVFMNSSLEKIEFLKVKEISNNAFYNNKKLKEVNLNGTYEIIPNYAFASCDNLQKVNIAATCKEIADYAFYNCQSLSTFNFDNVEKIGDSSFSLCNFNNLNLQNLIIGRNAFKGNEKLTTVSITNSDIDYNAFGNCENVNEVILSGVENIGSNAFKGCKLTSVSFDEKLISIGSEAFSENDIQMVSFANNSSLKTINRKAFYDNPITGNITIPQSVNRIYTLAFGKTMLNQADVYQNTIIDENSFDKECLIKIIE